MPKHLSPTGITMRARAFNFPSTAGSVGATAIVGPVSAICSLPGRRPSTSVLHSITQSSWDGMASGSRISTLTAFDRVGVIL